MTTTPGRWADPAWFEGALRWADDALSLIGARRTAWTAPHVRPWSTVLRLDTDTAGVVWLKANGDGTRHEAGLLGALAALGLPSTPRPLAWDAALGLTLLPDGGPSLREAHGGRTPIDDLEPVLAAYAVLQRETERHVDRLLALGLDDLRPASMPGVLAELIAACSTTSGRHRLDDRDTARLEGVLPAYADACGELAASGIAVTVQHDDLHDNNVLAAGPVIIDWGDAVVGHPFATMLTTLNSVVAHHSRDGADPSLVRLADAYTEAWTDVADRATLRRHVDLAVRVGPLTRAVGWRRALEGCDEPSWAEWGGGVHGWLLEILSPDLPLRPGLLG